MAITFVEEAYGYPKKITATWTTLSSSGGAVSGTTSNAYNGTVQRLVTVPGTSASALSANYDVTVSDEDSTDILMGGGANRHSANTEQVKAASLGVVAYDKLTFKIASAGSSHGGVIHLYII